MSYMWTSARIQVGYEAEAAWGLTVTGGTCRNMGLWEHRVASNNLHDTL